MHRGRADSGTGITTDAALRSKVIVRWLYWLSSALFKLQLQVTVLKAHGQKQSTWGLASLMTPEHPGKITSDKVINTPAGFGDRTLTLNLLPCSADTYDNLKRSRVSQND